MIDALYPLGARILLGLFHWSNPDPQYPTALGQRISYDCIWLGTVGLLVFIHYSLMAKGGYGTLAITLICWRWGCSSC